MAYTPIDKSDDYFSILLWTGDGTTKDITGVGFQPDLVWAKKRSASGFNAWCDVVRGGTKTIFSNSSIAEETSAADWILSFASDGFGVNSAGNLNQSSATYVAWNWLASNTTASNTAGSITSTVSANTTSGFSVVSTTGTGSAATIGHGLGAAPAMIIGKRRDSGSSQWRVYNKNLSSASHILYLDTQDGEQSGNSATWNNTAPTSTVFSVGSSGDVNASGGTFIFYCFAEIKGFSKFGKYTGNGSTDGAFVYTGFKPAWVMIKRIDSTSNWTILDNKRYGYNQASVSPREMYANSTDAESNSGRIDIVSNGFKLRSVGTDANGNGNSYVYMAFAENPFVTSTGIPTCAN